MLGGVWYFLLGTLAGLMLGYNIIIGIVSDAEYARLCKEYAVIQFLESIKKKQLKKTK